MEPGRLPGRPGSSHGDGLARPSVGAIEHELRDADPEALASLLERHATDPRKGVQTALRRARRRLARLEEDRARVATLYERARELAGPGLALGVDEVGRGSVAGPLTVCAVALPEEPHILGLNDSKQLTPKARERLATQIREVALCVGLCHLPPERIDEVGMGRAIREAMAMAIDDAIEGMDGEPGAVLIDGNPVHVHPREVCVVRGDATVAPIAAASIVAKVARDALMVGLDGRYPGYDLARSKGYASPAHIAAIRARGLSPIHRRSFCRNFVADEGQHTLF